MCRQITWGSCYGETPHSVAGPGRGLRSHISHRLSRGEEEASGLWTTPWTVQRFLQGRAAESLSERNVLEKSSKGGPDRWARKERTGSIGETKSPLQMTCGAGHPLSTAITHPTPIACLNSSMLDNGSASEWDEFWYYAFFVRIVKHLLGRD